jgi:hypothetical protein
MAGNMKRTEKGAPPTPATSEILVVMLAELWYTIGEDRLSEGAR